MTGTMMSVPVSPRNRYGQTESGVASSEDNVSIWLLTYSRVVVALVENVFVLCVPVQLAH